MYHELLYYMVLGRRNFDKESYVYRSHENQISYNVHGPSLYNILSQNGYIDDDTVFSVIANNHNLLQKLYSKF